MSMSTKSRTIVKSMSYKKLYAYMKRKKDITSKLEKMIGWSLFMSKVGIITLVNVSCNRMSPNFSFTILCKYSPSYFGPLKAFTIVIASVTVVLLFKKKEKK